MVKRLKVALRSVSDPQAQMQAIADRAVKNARDELNTKIISMEQATSLWHDDLVRVPTDVQKTAKELREFLQEFIKRSLAELEVRLGREVEFLRGASVRIDSILSEHQKAISKAADSIQHQFSLMKQANEDNIGKNAAISDEKFLRIDGAFVELNRQTTVLRSTDQLALAAALQTAEKAVNKTELNTAESIKALRLAFDDAMKAVNAKIDDVAKNVNAKIDAVTSRLDKGEGHSSATDPETSNKLEMMTNQIATLSARDREGFGRDKSDRDNSARMLSIAAIIVASLVGLISMIPHIISTVH